MMQARDSVGDAQGTYSGVGWTLLGGLLLSIAVMAAGLLLAAMRGEGSTSTVLHLDRELSALVKGQSGAVLDLGILLLFATPVAGVLVAFIQFFREGDRPFTLVTGTLLLLLCGAFAIALK